MRKAITAGEETSISESEFLHRKAVFMRLNALLNGIIFKKTSIVASIMSSNTQKKERETSSYE